MATRAEEVKLKMVTKMTEIEHLMECIQRDLEKYNRIEFPHYGHLGDLTEVAQQLRELREFTSGDIT